MRILIIPSQRYITQGEPLAGIFQQDQAHALKRWGFQIGIIAPRPRSLWLLRKRAGDWPKGVEFTEELGVPVYRYHGWGWIPGRTPYMAAWFYLWIGKRLFERYVADQGIPDIIHAHNALYAGNLALIIKKKYSIPYVITEHSSVYGTRKIRKWQISIIREIMRNASARIVVSRALGQLLEAKFGGIVSPWEWVPNIINRRFESQVFPKTKKNNSDKPFIFLTIGGLVKIKNHAGLLRAFVYKFKGKDAVRLRIGGDGPLRGRLKRLVNELGITSQVDFLGPLNRQQVLSEMLECDVFVLPSYFETFGLVLIEALACGKPVIAPANGGAGDIVNVTNGMLVETKDDAALGNAMDVMFRNAGCYDGVSIQKDCVAKFGEEVVVKQLKTIYHRVLEKRNYRDERIW